MYNNDTPPSTLRHLDGITDPLLHRINHGEPRLWFTKPSLINGITVLNSDTPLDQLRIVKLSLRSRGCIPFHRHRRKEKVYYVIRQDRPFSTHLGTIDPTSGKMHVSTLTTEQTFVVPKNHWHMIWTTSDRPIDDCLLVVSSSQEGDDIEWTPEGNILVGLSEKVGHNCQGETPLQLPFDQLFEKINGTTEDS